MDDAAVRAQSAAQKLAATAIRYSDTYGIDIGVLLGDALADPRTSYVSFELPDGRVPLLRVHLKKARSSLKDFNDLSAHVDRLGLHIRWRAVVVD